MTNKKTQIDRERERERERGGYGANIVLSYDLKKI